MPLDRTVRNVSVRKRHCVAFSYDGTYDLYEFDDNGNWRNIVTVNCSQWQTGGLLAARVGIDARHVLTLCHQGNFMCTSFK